MKEKIDIFADKPDVTLRYKIAVMQAKADNPDWVVQFTSKEGIVWYSLTDLDWNWVKHIFRIHPQHKPKIADGGNPQGLTEEQVGVKDGWRLLTLEEYNEGKFYNDLEYFSSSRLQWLRARSLFYFDRLCHRTKHPLPQPKKRVPLTMDDLPPVFWVRYIASGKWLSVLSIGHQELRLSDKSYHSMISLYESNEAEYSIDRKEVKPFWKEE